MHDVLVRHDWTYRELRRLSSMAAVRHWSVNYHMDEKCDVAMMALIEMLWAADESPDQWELLDYATRAVMEHVGRETGIHGKTREGNTAPRYTTYWDDQARPAEPVTDRIVEYIALTEVFVALDETDQELLWTRAMFLTARAAAAALSMSEPIFSVKFRAARDRANRLWFDEETARSWVGREDHRRSPTSDAATYRCSGRRRIRGRTA